MTDPSTPDACAPPISVKASATPAVMSELTKAALFIGFALVADRIIRSDAIKMAVVPLLGILATTFWSVWHRLRTYFALRFLADRAPDSIAKVGK